MPSRHVHLSEAPAPPRQPFSRSEHLGRHDLPPDPTPNVIGSYLAATSNLRIIEHRC